MLVLFLVLVGALIIAVQIPSVQTRAAQEAANFLSEKISHKVTVGSVNIRLFKKVVLDKVQVRDIRDQELFYIGNLEADISVFSIFHPNKLSIATLTLTEPHTSLIQYQGTDSLNLSTFIHALGRLIKKDPDAPKTAFDFAIDRIVLKNGYFSYDNQNRPHTDFGLDYQHLKLGNISGDLSGIEFLGDTIKVNIKGLTAKDKPSGTHLKKLDVLMTYAPEFWEWDGLDLRVGRSNLRTYVRFDYRRFHNFTDFNDSVNVTAQLRNSRVFSDDIALFAPQLKDYHEEILLSADAKGKTSRFDAKNVDLRYGRQSHVVGSFSATGLPNIRETFLELRLKPSVLDAQDLKTYIPANAFPYADRLGTVKLNGQFVGFYNDFVAHGKFETALGNLTSDINLKLNKNKALSSYKGYLKTDNFQVGTLIANPELLNSLTMEGKVQGTGFTPESAKLKLDATIAGIYFNGYNFRNITTNGNFSQQAFTGDFKINDPNLQIAGNGIINLEKTNQRINLKANIGHVNLKAINLIPQEIIVKSDVAVNFTGLKLDDFLGDAHLLNTTVTYNNNSVNIDSLVVNSFQTSTGRTLDLRSEILAFNATGNYHFSTLIRDITTLAQEYKLNFTNNTTATANYYRRKTAAQVPADYELDFNLNLKKVNPLLHVFVKDLTLSNHTEIKGSFRNGQTAIFGFNGKIDTVLYGSNKFYNNNLEVTTSKLPFSPDVLAQAFVTSKNQQIPGLGATENFFVEGVWNERQIAFSTNLAQSKTTNRASLSGNLNFLNDRVQFVFNPSDLNLLDKSWTISPNNSVEIKGPEIFVQNFVLSHQNQRFALSGYLSKDPAQTMQVKIANFEMQNLNTLMPQKMQGTLNADVALRDVYDQIIINSNLTLDSLYFDEVLIGNVAGYSEWDRRKGVVDVNLGITRDDKKVVNVTGTFNPDGGDNQLNLLAALEDAPVKLVEPFLKVIMSDMGGTMEGRIRVLGKLSAPLLKGVASVSNGRFKFNYLNTVYTFSDRVYFSETGITFRSLKLKDIYGNVASLNGSINHNGFQDMLINLKADFRKFMVLNTTRQQNDLYFGSAIATGDVSVYGPSDNLRVNVNARSEKGTRIAIPLNNQTKVARQSFIRFVNANTKDTTGVKVAVEDQKVDLSGINLDFNLDVTDDAYVEIIFDEKTGDIIRGTGNGRLRLDIDTRGEFNMYGTYEVTQGAYNFTLYNLVSKEFTVRPGGTISWNGDPYGGNLNIAATYSQRVSLTEIIQDSTSRGRYPVTVVMGLTGNLLTPDIKLGLEFDDSELPSTISSQLQPFLSSIGNDEQELNRQVFSLLAFKRLSPMGEFALNSAGTDALGSISEFLSNSFSTWIQQVDKNLELDIDLGAIDSRTGSPGINTRIGYRFLEGRLHVSRESSVTNNANTNSNSAALGDWRAEYYLRPDGKLRLKLQYVTSSTSFDNNSFYTSSASIMHTEQFDSFRELFGRKKLSKRLQELKEKREEEKRKNENGDDRPKPLFGAPDRPPVL